LLGLWEKPPQAKTQREGEEAGWEVPVAQVHSAMAHAFEYYNVVRMYADPPYWESQVDEWSGKYGKDIVLAWWTNRDKPMAYAIRAWVAAMKGAELTQDGNTDLTRHVGNAVRRDIRMMDEEGKPLFCIQKEKTDSPFKIDGCMAAILSYEAYGDAVKLGVKHEEPPKFQMMFFGGQPQ
jgi:hypothetical protein